MNDDDEEPDVEAPLEGPDIGFQRAERSRKQRIPASWKRYGA